MATLSSKGGPTSFHLLTIHTTVAKTMRERPSFQTATMFTATKFERLRQTGSAHRGLSLNRQARSETKPTTSPFDFMQFLAQHVQGYVAAQCHLCHLPVLKEMGNCVARSVQPDDKQRAITHVVFTRAAQRKGGVPVHPPRVLLGHHVQPNQGTCFQCFNWDAGPKPNQLPEDHRLCLQQEEAELTIRPVPPLVHSIARRLCTAAHCPKHPEKATRPLPTTVASDLTPPYRWFST